MSSAANLDPSQGEIALNKERQRPYPLNSLVASAKRITSGGKGNQIRKRFTLSKSWQDDAWDMYDLVGEQRFLASTLANRMSQARFFVGQLTDDDTEDPEPTDDPTLIDILRAVGHNAAGLAQMIQRLGVNMFVAGDGWLAGIPRHLLSDDYVESAPGGTEAPISSQLQALRDGDGIELSDLEWKMLSVSEVTSTETDKVRITLGEGDTVEVSLSEVYLIRVWRPHPRKWWEADSPTRSSLPVLRELVGLTMHISAQVDSRLAGAGVFIVPQSAVRAIKQQMGIEEDSQQDPFTDALMEAMITPISDRSSASAVVPLVIVSPDEAADKFQHIAFDKPLDTEARTLRDESIRRLALGQDAPPELLLGMAGMNHWGAWLVREDVVSTHIEPPLALICDALTTQYLWPVMRAMGYTDDEVKRHVIWYNVDHMILRPNRAADAMTLYDKGVLSDETLREASGFDDNDAPDTSGLDMASVTAFEMARQNPALIKDPGLAFLVDHLRAVLDGNPLPLPEPEPSPIPDEETTDEEEEGIGGEEENPPIEQEGPPDTIDDPAPEIAASLDPKTQHRLLMNASDTTALLQEHR